MCVCVCPVMHPFHLLFCVCVCLSGQSKYPWVVAYVPPCLVAQHCSGCRVSDALSNTADLTRTHSFCAYALFSVAFLSYPPCTLISSIVPLPCLASPPLAALHWYLSPLTCSLNWPTEPEWISCSVWPWRMQDKGRRGERRSQFVCILLRFSLLHHLTFKFQTFSDRHVHSTKLSFLITY